MTKNTSVAVGLFVLTVVLGVAYLKPTKVEVNLPEQTVATTQAPTYGAVPTLDGVDNPFVRINGKEYYYYNQPIAATSSVFCSIKNPFAPATTSVVAMTTRITDTISAAASFDIATGTGPYQKNGSSTPAFVYGYSVGAGLQDAQAWLPSVSTTTDDTPFGNTVWRLADIQNPTNGMYLTGSEYLNWKMATSVPGTDFFGGRCSALLQKI